MILVLVVTATVGVAAWVFRRERIALSPLPWDTADAARRQINVVTAQGAVAVTALVLLVTLASKTASQTASFNTVVVMFLTAFLWFVGVAVEYSYLPLEAGPEGVLLPRLLFVLAGIQHYRTLFLSWLALKPLVDTFHLVEPGTIFAWLLGVSVLTAWLIAASVCYRTGVLGPREALLVPAAGIVLAVALSLATHNLAPSPRSQDALILTLTIFTLNAVDFGVQAVAPMVYHRLGQRWIEMSARIYVLADLEASIVTLALLWLALLRPL